MSLIKSNTIKWRELLWGWESITWILKLYHLFSLLKIYPVNTIHKIIALIWYPIHKYTKYQPFEHGTCAKKQTTCVNALGWCWDGRLSAKHGELCMIILLFPLFFLEDTYCFLCKRKSHRRGRTLFFFARKNHIGETVISTKE